MRDNEHLFMGLFLAVVIVGAAIVFFCLENRPERYVSLNKLAVNPSSAQVAAMGIWRIR